MEWDDELKEEMKLALTLEATSSDEEDTVLYEDVEKKGLKVRTLLWESQLLTDRKKSLDQYFNTVVATDRQRQMQYVSVRGKASSSRKAPDTAAAWMIL